MRIKFKLLLALMAVALIAHPSFAAENAPSLEGFHNLTEVPAAALAAYNRFVEASKRGDPGDIAALSLPQALPWSTDARPDASKAYGTDVNMPFLKKDFISEIQLIRKEGDCCLLIRTPTSALWYVLTKNGDWKIYHYIDKPIQ